MAIISGFLTTSEAASVLQLHPETIKRFCRSGKLKADKVNNGWLIRKEAIDIFAAIYKEVRGRPANGRVHLTQRSDAVERQGN